MEMHDETKALIERVDLNDDDGFYCSRASKENTPRLFIVSNFLEDIGLTRDTIDKALNIENIYEYEVNFNVTSIKVLRKSDDFQLEPGLFVPGGLVILNYRYSESTSWIMFSRETLIELLNQWFERVKKLPKEIIVKETDGIFQVYPKEGTTFWMPPEDEKK